MSKEVKINPPAGGKKSLLLLEVGLIETVLVILALFLVFGALNYFNILSIYKLYPQQLGWLPHRPEQTKTINLPTEPKIFLSCPLPKEFCSKGKLVSEPGNTYEGLGFVLPLNSSIVAPFSGAYSISEITTFKDKKILRYMILNLKSYSYSAVFYYPSEGKQKTTREQAELARIKEAREGEEIIKIPKGSILLYPKENFNLIFYVYHGQSDIFKTRIPLKPQSLGEKIDLSSYK